MEKTNYTPEQTKEVMQLFSAIEDVPRDERSIVKLMAETFINGMKAHALPQAQQNSA